jgi:Mg-chelatase subunit ChlI
MSDRTLLEHISELVAEEHRLLAHPEDPEQTHQRLKHLAEQLDQCWDLLRQRRAKREFGEDPDTATPRDIGTVERYEN